MSEFEEEAVSELVQSPAFRRAMERAEERKGAILGEDTNEPVYRRGVSGEEWVRQALLGTGVPLEDFQLYVLGLTEFCAQMVEDGASMVDMVQALAMDALLTGFYVGRE